MVKDHLGRKYKSEVSRAHAFNIDVKIVNQRLDAGYSLEYALTQPMSLKKGKTVKDHLDNEYPSVRALCKHYNIPTSVYYTRLNKRHWTLERTLTTEYPARESKYSPNKIKDHLGEEFPSEKDMCRAHNIDYRLYKKRKEVLGWSLEKALTTPVSRIKINEIKGKYIYTYNNKHYYKCSHKDWEKIKILTVQQLLQYEKECS